MSALKKSVLLFVLSSVVLMMVYGFPIKPFYYFDTLSNVFEKSLASGKGGGSIAGMPHSNTAFYLLGNYSTNGWPYYYLVALLVKTPLSFLLLLAMATWSSRKRWLGLSDSLVLSTIGLLLLASCFNRVNIGLRHILPIYPLLFLYVGRLLDAPILSRNKTFFFKPIVLILTLCFVISSLLTYPHYLSFFNGLVSGPAGGHRVLDDSNIDWGQDLVRLAEIKQQYPDEPLYIATNWMVNPQAYGFEAQRLTNEQIANPPSGIVAVGKHWALRNRINKRSEHYFDWLEKYEPIGHIGHSILLYRFPESIHP